MFSENGSNKRTTTFRETDLKFLKEAPRDRENIGDNLKTRTKETSTFAEAVKKNLGGKVERGKKAEAKLVRLSWDGTWCKDSWLSKCAFRVLKDFSSVFSVNERLSNRGFSFFSIYLGDKKALWHFDSECDIIGLIKNRVLRDDSFLKMERWSMEATILSKSVWIEVFGVLLNCWSLSFFMKINNVLGEPPLVDENTVKKRRLDVGRLLVLIPFGHQCLGKIEEIGGDVTEKGQVVVSFISKANCEVDKADIVDSHQMGNRVKEKEKLEVDRGLHKKKNDKYEGFKKSVKSFCFKESGERTISETLFTNGQDKGKNVYVRKLKLNPWSVFVSSVRSKLDEEMWLKCVNGMLEGEYRRKGNDECGLSLLGLDSGPIQDSLNHDDRSHEGPH
ncbi:hypothetical protein LWI28_018006 [Acer negundo]|uniref:DUF4283 domain-containing protein n=1 Tax=Acer negundo TaxID=4023 RepID=A0AAD5JEQ3_ACENE|nr:hypothetical protein LWI28_018006 [Acer negundo]